MKRCIPFILIVLTMVTAFQGQAATPQELTLPVTDSDNDWSFRDCVNVALHNSSVLKRSKIEIELRKIDESDATYEYLPTVSIGTTYLVNPPPGTERPWSLSFSSSAINPWRTHYSIKARELATDIAVLVHIETVSEGLESLANAFIQLETATAMQQLQKDGQQLAIEAIAYSTNLVASGKATPLDMQVTLQEAAALAIEGEKLTVAFDNAVHGLKGLLGVPRDREIHLNLNNVTNQVFGSFDPALCSIESAMTNAPTLRIQSIIEKLNRLDIAASYARYVPNIRLGVQNPDALYSANNSELYFSVGLDFDLWDGRKKAHDVNRKKLVYRQTRESSNERRDDFLNRWGAAQDRLRLADADARLASARQELAKLRKEQMAAAYQLGKASFEDLADQQRDHLESRRVDIQRRQEYQQALLNLYHLSGRLLDHFVNALVVNRTEE